VISWGRSDKEVSDADNDSGRCLASQERALENLR
jgi:hypothetical protein